MAIRKRLVRKEEQPRQRFTRGIKPVEKDVEPEEKEQVEEADDKIPAEFEPEEKPAPIVRKVVVPPPPAKGDKPTLYHKREVTPKVVEELPAPAKVLVEPEQMELPMAMHVDKDATQEVSLSRLLGLLERIVAVQESLGKLVKMYVGDDPTETRELTAKQAEYVATPEAKAEKAKKPVKEFSTEYLAWSEEWRKLSFEQKAKKAKAAGVKWEKHTDQGRENINLTMAYRKALKIEKYA